MHIQQTYTQDKTMGDIHNKITHHTPASIRQPYGKRKNSPRDTPRADRHAPSRYKQQDSQDIKLDSIR